RRSRPKLVAIVGVEAPDFLLGVAGGAYQRVNRALLVVIEMQAGAAGREIRYEFAIPGRRIAPQEARTSRGVHMAILLEVQRPRSACDTGIAQIVVAGQERAIETETQDRGTLLADQRTLRGDPDHAHLVEN